MGLSVRHKARIDAALDACLGEWFPGLAPRDLEALRAIVAGGKRLRGALACLVAEALGASSDAAMPAALAIEIIQAASLVHDDFVDGDALRRGRAAAWTVLAPRRAVLLADMMFATAIEKMAQAGAAESAALAQAIAAMARGAFEEASGGAHGAINRAKTGALFAAAARLGALAAKAGAAQLQAAHEFGALAGEAYQLADDLADGAPRARIVEQIGALVGRARAALAPFPDNESTRLLAEAPAEFVRRALTIAEP